MTDYGHDLLLGTMIEPPSYGVLETVQLAELTELLGLDLVSIADHPYWPQRLDAVTLLSWIAARTSRVTVLANLFNLPLRPPTVLARTAATLDLLTGGRCELGVASGAQQMWDLIVAEGGPRRTAGASIEALEEAVQIVRCLWTPGDPLVFDGRHYHLAGVQRGPTPAHDVQIWLGGYQPRMMRMIGRVGDGILPSSPYFDPDRWPQANEIIDHAAVAAGRAPEAVRRIYNIAGDFSATGTGFLQGPPKVWVEQLTELTLNSGVSGYILYRAQDADVIRQFAGEVAPALRESVESERARGGRAT